MKNKRIGLWKRIIAYKLRTQVIVSFVLSIIFMLSVVAYNVPEMRNDAIISNLLIAIFTSLLVTIFTMVADIVVSYTNHKNEELFEDLHTFGIKSLYQDKKEALKQQLYDCDNIIWISGYRLILTKELIQDISFAIDRGANVQAVICPPWSEAFKMVYGDNEKVIDNYLSVFSSINQARKKHEGKESMFEIVFVDKPIFSDTYRVDQNLITGPYMHNLDNNYHRLMAKDFFSYNIARKSPLYDLVTDEYRVLFNEAKWKLDWNKFEVIYNKIECGDERESEKIEDMKSACVLIEK